MENRGSLEHRDQEQETRDRKKILGDRQEGSYQSINRKTSAVYYNTPGDTHCPGWD